GGIVPPAVAIIVPRASGSPAKRRPPARGQTSPSRSIPRKGSVSMSTATTTPSPKQHAELETVVIRFAGDSGDGMQLTGTQFTTTSALVGNDIATLPDFPAEIRAPAGTLPGVSGFQLNFSSLDIYTPGDAPDVLVAMNPAALKINLPDLRPN